MHSLGIVQWNSNRRDHPGNLGGVSGSGPVTVSALVSLMTGTEVSHIPGIPASTGNLFLHVRADGNGNISSVLTD